MRDYSKGTRRSRETAAINALQVWSVFFSFNQYKKNLVSIIQQAVSILCFREHLRPIERCLKRMFPLSCVGFCVKSKTHACVLVFRLRSGSCVVCSDWVGWHQSERSCQNHQILLQTRVAAWMLISWAASRTATSDLTHLVCCEVALCSCPASPAGPGTGAETHLHRRLTMERPQCSNLPSDI